MSTPDNLPKENSTDTLPGVTGDQMRAKAPSKAIRLLTVIVYVLSVSLAAIFLSVYYIFIWKDKTFVSAQPLVYTTENSYNTSLLEAMIFENLSHGLEYKEASSYSTWNSTVADEVQQIIDDGLVINATRTSTTTEENSTWLDDDTFNPLSEEDEKSSDLLNKLIFKKYPYAEND